MSAIAAIKRHTFVATVVMYGFGLLAAAVAGLVSGYPVALIYLSLSAKLVGSGLIVGLVAGFLWGRRTARSAALAANGIETPDSSTLRR